MQIIQINSSGLLEALASLALLIIHVQIKLNAGDKVLDIKANHKIFQKIEIPQYVLTSPSMKLEINF